MFHLTLLFGKKEQNQWCKVTEIIDSITYQTVLMVSVAYGQPARGGSQGGRMRGMRPPPAIFKNIFDVYNFSIISNLFDSDKSYALTLERPVRSF